MELVGLEPTTSWVRYGRRLCGSVGVFGFRERKFRLGAINRSIDSRGLPGITFHSGTGKTHAHSPLGPDRSGFGLRAPRRCAQVDDKGGEVSAVRATIGTRAQLGLGIVFLGATPGCSVTSCWTARRRVRGFGRVGKWPGRIRAMCWFGAGPGESPEYRKRVEIRDALKAAGRTAAFSEELMPPDLDRGEREEQVDSGYGVCDAALRRHLDPELHVARGLPFSRMGGARPQ